MEGQTCLIAKESLENSDIDKSPLHQYTEVPPPMLLQCKLYQSDIERW